MLSIAFFWLFLSWAQYMKNLFRLMINFEVNKIHMLECHLFQNGMSMILILIENAIQWWRTHKTPQLRHLSIVFHFSGAYEICLCLWDSVANNAASRSLFCRKRNDLLNLKTDGQKNMCVPINLRLLLFCVYYACEWSCLVAADAIYFGWRQPLIDPVYYTFYFLLLLLCVRFLLCF